MRLLVWGASPQAAWLAARFHQQATWLTTDTVAADLAQFGQLELISPHNFQQVTELSITTDSSSVLKPPLDWIVLAMPIWALDDALWAMSRRIPPDKCPPLLTVQSGIGGIEKIRGFFPDTPVIQAILTRTLSFPMVDHHTAAYETVVSDGVGGIAITNGDNANEAAHLLRHAGLGSVMVHEQEQLRWSDLLWQIQANAVATLMDIEPTEVYDSARLFDIEYRQLREAIRIIDQQRINLVSLPSVDVPRLGWQIRVIPKRLLRFALRPNAKPPSLRPDLMLQSGRSDAAYLNGAVAKTAYDSGSRAPVNHALALGLTDIAEGRALWSQFRNQVSYLETIIRIATSHS